MGAERFVGPAFQGGTYHPAIANINEALAAAVRSGATEQAIDFYFARLGDQARVYLAYLKFDEHVKMLAAQIAEQQRAHAAAAPAEKPAATSDPDRGKLKAVEGRTGIYSRQLGDGTMNFVAKWPDSSKTSGTATKGGFETVDAAQEHYDQMTSKEAVA